MKKLLTLSLIVLSGIMLGACSDKVEPPAQAAETFFNEILQGDVKKAISLTYLPPEVNNPLGIGMLEQVFTVLQQELKKKGGVKSVKAEKVTYNSDKTQATVILTIEANDGKSRDTKPIEVIKEGDVWKVKMK